MSFTFPIVSRIANPWITRLRLSDERIVFGPLVGESGVTLRHFAQSGRCMWVCVRLKDRLRKDFKERRKNQLWIFCDRKCVKTGKTEHKKPSFSDGSAFFIQTFAFPSPVGNKIISEKLAWIKKSFNNRCLCVLNLIIYPHTHTVCHNKVSAFLSTNSFRVVVVWPGWVLWQFSLCFSCFVFWRVGQQHLSKTFPRLGFQISYRISSSSGHRLRISVFHLGKQLERSRSLIKPAERTFRPLRHPLQHLKGKLFSAYEQVNWLKLSGLFVNQAM